MEKSLSAVDLKGLVEFFYFLPSSSRALRFSKQSCVSILVVTATAVGLEMSLEELDIDFSTKSLILDLLFLVSQTNVRRPTVLKSGYFQNTKTII